MTAALALLLAVAPAPDPPTTPDPDPPPTVEGTWTATEADGALRLALSWPSSYFRRAVPLGDLDGWPAGRAAGPAEVAFRLDRAAGALAFEGALADGAASGRFRFLPDPEFARGLTALGVEGGASASALLDLALAGATLPGVRSLLGADLGPLAVDDVVRLAVLDVTAEYVRAIRASGVRGVTLDGAVVLRVRDVTPTFVADLAAAGYPALDAREVSDLCAHGVTGAFVAELAALGYTDLSPGRLVELGVLGVDPAFIRAARAAGGPAPSLDDLVARRARADR